MIYLVVSLVAGLFFLISGKVQYRKTVFLEGTKARIAGLIFLAPVGLVLAIIGAEIVLAILGINISDSSSTIIDNFASTFVQDGFAIGLAYINFYSVSREIKERGGCLTYWLIYMAFAAMGLIWFLRNLSINTPLFTFASISIPIFQTISLIGIWFWKKLGVFSYVTFTLLFPIAAYFRVESVLQASISLISSLSYILILYLLVKPKWQFFE